MLHRRGSGVSERLSRVRERCSSGVQRETEAPYRLRQFERRSGSSAGDNSGP